MPGFHVHVRAANGRFYTRTLNPRGRIRFTRAIGKAALYRSRAMAERVIARFRASQPTTTFRVEAV